MCLTPVLHSSPRSNTSRYVISSSSQHKCTLPTALCIRVMTLQNATPLSLFYLFFFGLIPPGYQRNIIDERTRRCMCDIEQGKRFDPPESQFPGAPMDSYCQRRYDPCKPGHEPTVDGKWVMCERTHSCSLFRMLMEVYFSFLLVCLMTIMVMISNCGSDYHAPREQLEIIE